VSIRTLQGRIVLPFEGSGPHVALIQHGATIKAGRLWYDKQRKQFYLLVCLEQEIADATPEVQQAILGVDVGQRYLAVTATVTEESQFFSGTTVQDESRPLRPATETTSAQR
jgi:putative transposase